MSEETTAPAEVVIETVKVELQVPKESKEVVDFFTEVVKMVKAKAEATQYMALIPKLTDAVSGYEKLSPEMKSTHKDDLVAYITKEIASLF